MGLLWVFWCWIQGVMWRRRSSKQYLDILKYWKCSSSISLIWLTNTYYPCSFLFLLFLGAQTSFSSVISFSSVVKLNIISLLPLPNPMSQRNLPFHCWFGLRAYREALSWLPWRPQLVQQTTSDSSFRHKRICVVRFLSYDAADTCLSSIKQPLRQSYINLLHWSMFIKCTAPESQQMEPLQSNTNTHKLVHEA